MPEYVRSVDTGNGYRLSVTYDRSDPLNFHLVVTGPRGGHVLRVPVDVSQANLLKEAITGANRAAWKASHEQEPVAVGLEFPLGCGSDCPQSGKWGATGEMPPGHHWQWRDHNHKSGYLAHTPAAASIALDAKDGTGISGALY